MLFFFRVFFIVILAQAFIISTTFAETKQEKSMTWSPKVFEYVKKNFGDDAEKRVRYLNKVIIKNRNKPIMEKLVLVNNTFNNFPWIADDKHWKKADYWATPFQVISTFGGDCEDISIAKFAMLRHLGVQKDQLYFGYVKLKLSNQAHMVLLYKATPNVSLDTSDVYILDNIDPEVKLGSKRNDIYGIYAFDSNGKIYLIQDDGKQRSIKKSFKPRHFKRFKELKSHFDKEKELFKQLNDGKYLFND